MVKEKYLSDTYLKENTSKITQIVTLDGSVALYFENTIFYPQGGGQPCDIGELIVNGITYPVYHTEITELGIAHLINCTSPYLMTIGQDCKQLIDINQRLFNAKYHTAGHLISHILEQIYHNLSPIKGQHYPDNSYIEMQEKEKTTKEISLKLINEKIDVVVNKSPKSIKSIVCDLKTLQSLRPLLSQLVPQNERIRMIDIDGFTPLPCKGTHVSCTSELKGLQVTKIKRKKNRIKVNYSIN